MELPLLDPELTAKHLGLTENQKVNPTVFAITENGPALIMNEGVGWFADDDDNITVLCSESYNDFVRTIHKSDVPRLLSTNTITLEDFIGTYNDRYRNNLYLWTNQVEGVDQSMSVA